MKSKNLTDFLIFKQISIFDGFLINNNDNNKSKNFILINNKNFIFVIENAFNPALLLLPAIITSQAGRILKSIPKGKKNVFTENLAKISKNIRNKRSYHQTSITTELRLEYYISY